MVTIKSTDDNKKISTAGGVNANQQQSSSKSKSPGLAKDNVEAISLCKKVPSRGKKMENYKEFIRHLLTCDDDCELADAE